LVETADGEKGGRKKQHGTGALFSHIKLLGIGKIRHEKKKKPQKQGTKKYRTKGKKNKQPKKSDLGKWEGALEKEKEVYQTERGRVRPGVRSSPLMGARGKGVAKGTGPGSGATQTRRPKEKL